MNKEELLYEIVTKNNKIIEKNNKIIELQQENKQLKEQLNQKNKIIEEIKKYIKPLVTEREDEKYYFITWYCKDVLLSWLGDEE